uniref:Uncharacterized protein n=1 Tax=Glossina brevipalpis TaxID=37001 RepID=A0A1A9X361_9MUSC
MMQVLKEDSRRNPLDCIIIASGIKILMIISHIADYMHARQDAYIRIIANTIIIIPIVSSLAET